jgi:hypothetical protein
MNMLLNGCSFMDNYYYVRQFSHLLDATVTNIAKAGSSNRRIIRTTVNHIEKNSVDFVILGLTFYDRQESPFLTIPKPREGHWVSYNNQGMQATFCDVSDFDSTVEHKMVGDYILDRYRYDIGIPYLEQLYLDLRMFSGYLKNKGIGYCIFNTCERHHENIDLGTGFVPFDFIGNEYLEQNGCQPFEQDLNLPANARHHYGEDVIILVKYLIDRINEL